MDIVSEDHNMRPHCEAAQFTREVDDRLNVFAQKEAAEATNKLRDFGADLGEGSAYLDPDEAGPLFTEKSATCGLCKGVARLFPEGFVQRARQCAVSGSCEMVWVEKHPENYRDEDGNLTVKQLICAAELGCKALIVLEETPDGLKPSIAHAQCRVEQQGDKWRAQCALPIVTEPIDPEAGMQDWDGEGSGRESVS